MHGLLRPRAFARGWTAVLAGLVAVGLTLEALGQPRLVPGLLEFDWTHDLLHVVLLALAAYFGWLARPASMRRYAQAFGIGGLVVAVVGFVPAWADAVHAGTGWHFELGENVVHAALGIWGTFSGFAGSRPDSTD